MADELGCSTREYAEYFNPDIGEPSWSCKPCWQDGWRRFDYVVDDEPERVHACLPPEIGATERVALMRHSYETTGRTINSIVEIDPEGDAN